jgi:hypothetical protein
VITNGWLDAFLRVDGHPLKLYAEENTGENGLACHNIVGEEADFLDGVPDRFLSDERVPGEPERFTDYAAASCMFILRKRMPSIQMYPTWGATWTSGGRVANTTTWAMEAEGGGYIRNSVGTLIQNFGEPLSRKQEDEVLLIARAWEWQFGRKLVVGETVRAHWQIAQRYNYPSTACESGRYANAWARLAAGERGEELPDPRIDKLIAALGGEAAVDEWNARGNSLLTGYALEQQKLGEHLHNHAAGVTGAIPEHEHLGGKVKR